MLKFQTSAVYLSDPMSSFLTDILKQITEKAHSLLENQDGSPVERLMQRCLDLLSGKGEATGLAIANDVFAAYAKLDNEQKAEFWRQTEQSLGIDIDALNQAIHSFQNGQMEAVADVHHLSEPKRQELFRRLNSAPSGTLRLIKMRESLGHLPLEGSLKKRINADFVHLFSSWFNKGFLELKQINWQTSADVLEKLIAYESVHEIQGWDDLRRRLRDDRRCFGYFHPAMPDEPLIFVEVALVNGMSDSVEELLNAPEASDKDADTAVFYSINNCQAGLAGVSFGNFLIKQVVEVLRQTAPQIKTFVTLSPIPNLRAWVEKDPQRQALMADPKTFEALCVHYLTRIEKGRVLDPVARFHLGNGARLERINLNADMSEMGQRRSYGTMVNYLYESDSIIQNHEALMSRGEIAVAAKLKKYMIDTLPA